MFNYISRYYLFFIVFLLVFFTVLDISGSANNNDKLVVCTLDDNITQQYKEQIQLVKSKVNNTIKQYMLTHDDTFGFLYKDKSWKQDNIYIVVANYKTHIVVFNQAILGMIGADLEHIKTYDRVKFSHIINYIISLCNNRGWVHYMWPKPRTRKIAEKWTYIEIIPGTPFLVAAGFYLN